MGFTIMLHCITLLFYMTVANKSIVLRTQLFNTELLMGSKFTLSGFQVFCHGFLLSPYVMQFPVV